MRSNALKTCAVGVMLIGGTFGAASTANAGLTWLGGTAGFEGLNAMAGVQVLDSEGNPDAYAESIASGSVDSPFNLAGVSLTYNGTSQLSFSGMDAFTGGLDTGGFSFSANPATGTTRYASIQYQGFTVTDGAVDITLAFGSGVTFAGANASGFRISVLGLDGNYSIIHSFASVGQTQTFTLGVGTYNLETDVFVNDGYSGNVMSFSVPAPGAAALVGLASLVGGRRRKG